MIRVAVYGGDDRIHDLKRRDQNAHVKTYPGTDENANRIINGMKLEMLTHVYVLQRWMSHSQYDAIKNAARQYDVAFKLWPQGLGELRKELARVAEEEADVLRTMPPLPGSPRCFRCRQPIANATGEEHELCAACATPEVGIPPATQGEPVTTKTKMEKGAWPKLVLEAIHTAPEREWTVRAVYEVFGAKTVEEQHPIAATLRALIAKGALKVTGGVPKSPKNPQRFCLPTAASAAKALPRPTARPAPAAPPKPPASVPRPAAAPAPAVAYVLLDVLGHAHEYPNREEALEALRANPGARMFREVRTRVTVEIDE